MNRVVAIVALITVGFSATAVAKEGGPFGLGIIIGDPTGINGKLFINRINAIEGSAAWSVEGANDFQLQGDYLFHNYDLIKVQKGELPVFFGVGGVVSFRESRDNLVGIRFPVGMDYFFSGAPFDVFGQIVPILLVSPSTDFEIEAALGVRFWF